MSFTDQSQTNFTVGQQYQGLMGLLLFSTLTTAPCCVFLFINGTLLFTLRSKSVFRETSRYILLFNLLVADTVLLAESQIMYIIASCRVRLSYPVCGCLIMLAHLTSKISPLTLVVMSLERYVAVCYPLRHAAIVTVRNTAAAIAVLWACSSLNVLVRVLLLFSFPFGDLESLQMRDFCSNVSLVLDPVSDLYDTVYTYLLFLSACVAVTSSFIRVMVAARSASTDKASARKAQNTLLLHLVQLVLSLSSTIYGPILTALSRNATRAERGHIQIILYVCISLLPRCLSSLVYGIRDQTIRPVLMYHFCCRLKHSRVS